MKKMYKRQKRTYKHNDSFYSSLYLLSAPQRLMLTCEYLGVFSLLIPPPGKSVCHKFDILFSSFQCSVGTDILFELGQVLWCFYVVGPVVFSLVLFIYQLMYVNLCLSHLILTEIISIGLIQFMLSYSQLTQWQTANYICSSFWCIVR